MLFPSINEIAIPNPVTISTNATVSEAVELMAENQLRNLVVVDEDSSEYTLFTANDLIQINSRQEDLQQTLAERPRRKLPCFSFSTNVLEVFDQLSAEDNYMGVLSKHGVLVGIVSYTDLVSSIDPEVIIEQQELASLFHGNELHVTPADTPLNLVLSQMKEVDDCLVVLEREQPVGIVTTKDAVRLIASRASLDTPVSEVMTQPLETIPHSATIREALEFLKERHFKRIVVTEEDRLLGVVRQRELVNLAYSRWAEMLRNHAGQLQDLVGLLERKAFKLEQLATTDTLTGIANRYKFERRLRREIYRCNRYGKEPLSLLLIDLDRFKRINDSYGHTVGDKVLKAVVRLLKNNIRESDLLGRWGGEEFMLLLPATALDNAHIVAESLRQKIADHEFKTVGHLTISIGLTEFQRYDEASHFVEQADLALYQAKADGRNCVRIHSD